MRIRFPRSFTRPLRAFLSAPACLACLALCPDPIRAQDPFEGIDKHKLTVKAYLDFGHIVNGYNYYDPDARYDIA
jgi:hypothetical protein